MASSIQNASDAELIDIAVQCFDVMNANLADYPNVTQQQVDDLKTFKDAFVPEVTAHVAKQAAAKAQTLVKDAKRTPVEVQLALLKNIAKAAGATEAAMAATGIPSGGGGAPPTATRPVAMVDTSQRLQHTISWVDEAALNNKKRPRGTIGAEIWIKLGGPAPTDPSESAFLTLDTATPYTTLFDGPAAGQMAHYMLRWRLTDGTTSPWSETVSATITG